jgi:hypothetical protein
MTIVVYVLKNENTFWSLCGEESNHAGSRDRINPEEVPLPRREGHKEP